MSAKGWLASVLILSNNFAIADEAQIQGVRAVRADQTFTFSVTLLHADTGWDDYADGWRVEDGNGVILGTRELLHPHVNEQPFTRSLAGVLIPDGVKKAFIRSRTNKTGWGDTTLPVTIGN